MWLAVALAGVASALHRSAELLALGGCEVAALPLTCLPLSEVPTAVVSPSRGAALLLDVPLASSVVLLTFLERSCPLRLLLDAFLWSASSSVTAGALDRALHTRQFPFLPTCSRHSTVARLCHHSDCRRNAAELSPTHTWW